jgi:YidC/Oxa1 family membrane protein insertase
MLTPLWNNLLFYPLVNGLIFLYKLTGNFGWSIIMFTVLLRFIMTPLVIPSLKISKKVAELAPELAKLKEKYKNDQQALMAAQAELYKQHGANPAAGCLPQIIQLLVLIALFNSLNLLLHSNGTTLIQKLDPILYSFNRVSSDFNLKNDFLYLQLTHPDTINISGLPFPIPGLFLVLSAVLQLISGKMMVPVVKTEKKVAEKTSEDVDDAAVAAQAQMLYFLPLMTVVFGYQFPSDSC